MLFRVNDRFSALCRIGFSLVLLIGGTPLQVGELWRAAAPLAPAIHMPPGIDIAIRNR